MHLGLKKYVLILVLLLSTQHLVAQQQTILKDSLPKSVDTLVKSIDTLVKITKPSYDTSRAYYAFRTKKQIPKRAAMYSALLPGLGQVYNKQIWKTPIVYGGLGVATYFIVYNQSQYNLYRTALISRLDSDPTTVDNFTNYSITDLRTLQRKYRASLDRIGVFTSVWYGVNIIDALVSAHLKDFNMSKDLSYRPLINQNGVGIAFNINQTRSR